MNWSWADAQKLLAFLIVISFVMIVTILIFHPLPSDSGNLYTMIGALGALANMVAGYYFGSSKSSADKDDSRDNTMTKLVDKVTANGTGDGAPKP